jgi:Glycosyltransferase family 87
LQYLRSLILPRGRLFSVYALVAIIASVQLILVPPHFFAGKPYTDYNNYVIFRQSFSHLISERNLYAPYPAEQWDIFKYSPAFALFMGALAWLPDMAGLIIWNMINVLALYFAVRALPFKIIDQNKLLIFLILELLTSIQNSQSNGLMAGLLIGAYTSLQRGKVHWATLWLVLATFIKVYGAVGFCLFLFYPDKIRFIFYAAAWTIIFAVLPLVAVPFHALLWQYQNWGTMMLADESASYGLSVMGWLQSWFGINKGKSVVTLVGLLCFIIPFSRFSLYRNEAYKLNILAFMLVWVVIFNHKAESPTFIIALAGIAIWYFSSSRQLWRDVLMGVVFVFTCLLVTDLFPSFMKERFFEPYNIKVVPCIIAWCIIFTGLLKIKHA